MKISDKQIIANIENKDEKTLRLLRSEYLPLVKYMVLNYNYSDGKRFVTAEAEEAEDLLHDALYILIKKILDGKLILTGKLSSYFYAICKNLLKVKLKKKLHELQYRKETFENVESSEEFIFDANLKKKIFDHYFNKLKKSCQEIMKMYWLDYSVKEIAKETGFTKNYVMKHKYECKKKLMELVKRNPENI
jgi:RNA polymerase sigma factor (sigma-70 family)